MAVAGSHQIVDSSLAVIVNFDGASGYNLYADWRPNVATKKTSAFVGGSVYNDVTQSIPLVIEGSTVAEVLSRRDALVDIVTQGARWYAGEKVEPRLHRYAHWGSSSTPTLAPIIGEDENSPVIEFEGWPTLVNENYQQRVVWTFKELGGALSGEDTATTTQVEGGEVATVSLSAAVSLLSPTKIRSAQFADVSGNQNPPKGVVILTESTAVQVVQGGTLEVGAWTTNAAAGDNALGNTTYTATGSDGYVIIGATETALRDGRLIVPFTVAKVASGSVWKVTPYLQIGNFVTSLDNSQSSFVVGRPTYISETRPNVYALSPVSVPVVASNAARFQFIYVRYERVSGSGAITFNYHAMVATDNEDTNIIRINGGAFNDDDMRLIVDHQLPFDSRPFVGLEIAISPLGTVIPLSYSGSPYFFTRSQNLALLYMLVQSDSDTWRFPFDITTDVTRREVAITTQ